MMRPWIKRVAIAVAGLSGVAAVAVGGALVHASLTWADALQFPDTPYPDLSASTDPAVVERGRYLARGPAHCAQCHTTGDRERPQDSAHAPFSGGLEFSMGPLGSLYARNLTPHATTGIGRRTDAELARTLRTGVLPEGELSIFMRLSAAELADEDIVAVISWLRSLEPVENAVPDRQFSLLGKAVVRYGFPTISPRTGSIEAVQASPDGPSEARGRYLAEHVALCVMCHTAFDQSTFQPMGPPAGGGTPEPSHGDDADMEFCAPNLTSHPTGVTGRLTEDAFVARLKAGRVHASSIMPWEGFQATTDDDLRSIYRYLRTLPPVDHDAGPGYRPIGWVP